jgi:hypothetical protein
MTTRDLALRALVVKHIADITAAAIKQHRTELAGEMTNGDRINVTDPTSPDVDLGHVLRTKPRGNVLVTDRDAFVKWMGVNYPDRVQVVITLPQRNLGEAIEVLYQHAPHLIEETPTVLSWAENEVLVCTERAKEPCGPGGELDIPGVTYEPPRPGAITIKLSEDAPAAIERMWRQGRINLHTGEIRALPAGDSP